ncbi:MFS transporter [Stackebrandtia nassauensis]|uniref:Putative proline/betaine transporter n=1 Tax=Stackebrandtia nassauensis (strain DSM 44728 / CIP 108903 / NRRL B-16338 / NBRC 102104 / LLR-40K-21) TaxID=446470 RepID=D3Q9N4_STANL|nr:MFS transporter [Stackebrandtia nassauensis]ADD44580.1 General substrate transporter [Stackebrandtia nassauensis DSM 44728]
MQVATVMPQRVQTWWDGFLAKRGRPLTTGDITVVKPPELKRATAAASVGNCMEWYDFGVFSYLTATIGAVFYPSGNPVAQLLASFATFSVAFLVRPLGGLFFGPLGDRIGRTKVLAATMVLMAVGTFAIGFIPSYASIGIAAPILLLLARMLQGFSTGGEYGGASTFTAEYAPDRRRGYFCSFLDFGTFIGYAIGSGVVTLMTLALSETAMLSWGWRIPFLVAGPLGLIGLYIRLKLEDTPAYQQQEEAVEAAEPPVAHPIRTTVRDHWRPLLVCMGLVLLYNVTNYMVTAYLPTYLTQELGQRAHIADMFILAAMVLVVVTITFIGRASDRYGRKVTFNIGAVGLVVLALPCFWMMRAGGVVLPLAGVLVLALLLAFFAGTSAATLPALFPTRIRYTAMAVGFNISVAAFGGTTPLVTEALVAWSGDLMVPAYYLMAAGAIGLIAIAYLPETAGLPLAGAQPQVVSSGEARELVMVTREYFTRLLPPRRKLA